MKIKTIVFFLDVLGPTAFAPVKSDINGNIKVRPFQSYAFCYLVMFLSYDRV